MYQAIAHVISAAESDEPAGFRTGLQLAFVASVIVLHLQQPRQSIPGVGAKRRLERARNVDLSQDYSISKQTYVQWRCAQERVDYTLHSLNWDELIGLQPVGDDFDHLCISRASQFLPSDRNSVEETLLRTHKLIELHMNANRGYIAKSIPKGSKIEPYTH